jgi:hypothetical protein
MKEIRFFLLFFFTSLSPVVSGETLLKGAIYFDPRETLEKIVVSKKRQHSATN